MTSKPGYKECPACAETIKEKAKLCRFCGAVLTDEVLPRIATREERDLTREEDQFLGGQEDIADMLMMQHRHRLERVLRGSEDQYRSASVVFIDLVGYTSLCESLRPEETKEILDAYYAICGHIVDFYNGFILEFQGDGCLAVFGAPVAYERDAESAIRASLAVLERIRGLPVMHGKRVQAAAGIETGIVLSSVIRTRTPPVYKVFGNAVNLAARVRGTAAPGTVVIGPETYEIVRELFRCRKAGVHQFKNVEKSVQVYEVLGFKGADAVRRDFSIPFVGRERELQKIAEVWERCFSQKAFTGDYPELTAAPDSDKDSGPTICGVYLEGEPGIGKTRLTLEFASRQSGALTAHVEGAPYSAKVPWELWRGILAELLEGAARDAMETDWHRCERSLEELGYHGEDAMPILAILGDPRALQHMQGLPIASARRLLRAELREFLRRVAEKRTALILILDDLQWSDRTSLEALDAMLTSPPRRTFFMLAYRNDEMPGLEQLRVLERVKLRGLDLRNRRALFSALADFHELLPELRERIIQQEAGNPFYMLELARTAARVAQGELPATVSLTDSDIERHGTSLSRSEYVPSSLLEILQSRIDSLDQRRKLVIQCAAVLGKRFSLEFIEFFNFIQEGLLARLYSLKSLQLLDDAVTVTGLEFFFLHHVTREVSYRTLLLRQRRELHTFVAEELERRHKGNTEHFAPVLAYHWSQADNDDRAIPHLKISGDQAAGMGALPEALEHYDEALRRLRKGAPTAENRRQVAQLLRARGKLQRLAGQTRAALESQAEALNACQKLRDKMLVVSVRVEAGMALVASGDYARARTEFEWGIPVARKNQNQLVEGELINGLGMCAWGEGDFNGAEKYYKQAQVLALKSNTPILSAAIHNNLALLSWKAGRLGEAITELKKALKLWQQTGDKFSTAATVMNLGILEENLGRFESAEKRYREALELAQRIGYQHVLTATHANLGNLCLLRQRAADALRHSSQALHIAENMEDRRSAAIALENMALSHLALQDVAEGKRLVKQANRVAEQIGDAERLFSLELAQIELQLADNKNSRLAPKLAKAERVLEVGGYEAERPRLFRLLAMNHAASNKTDLAEAAAHLALECARKQSNGAEEMRLKGLLQQIRNR